MELGTFKSSINKSSNNKSDIIILRIDPEKWNLNILTLSGSNQSKCMNAKEWCGKFNMVAGINAGMFDADFATHIGFMKCGNQSNNLKVNSYKSVAAFSPRKTGLPLFRIYDIDETNIETIKKQYRCVIQNLRLIKRPGKNKWGQQNKKWSEAALGEDKSGRILFIFCKAPYSMHDFSDILLHLPIDLVCAQHLEGGPEAQMYVNINSTEIELAGSYETGFNENSLNLNALPVPNILAISPR
jgi:exopolysaccharide biosynthesis protein